MTHYDYGFRIYNPSIARFLSVDPLTYGYPELTPYQFASNTPIWAIDLDGLEAITNQELLKLIRDKKPKVGDVFSIIIPTNMGPTGSFERPPMQIYPGKVVSERNGYAIRNINIDGVNVVVYDQFSSTASKMFAAKLDSEKARSQNEIIGYVVPVGGALKLFSKFFKSSKTVSSSAKVAKECTEQGCGYFDDFAKMSDKASDAAKTGMTAYKTALAGGKHSGFLKNYLGRSADEIGKSIRSMQTGKQGIGVHLDKIANPTKYVPNWNSLRPGHQQNLINGWQNTVTKHTEQIQILNSILGR